MDNFTPPEVRDFAEALGGQVLRVDEVFFRGDVARTSDTFPEIAVRDHFDSFSGPPLSGTRYYVAARGGALVALKHYPAFGLAVLRAYPNGTWMRTQEGT